MRILLHPQFEPDVKTLGKKYHSLEADIEAFMESLEVNPIQGDALGQNRYKVRLKIASKGKGKSGGGRVITYLRINEDELWLLTLYDKSEIGNVNDSYLDDLVKYIPA